MQALADQARQFGYLFYIASPNTTTFQTQQQIPNYVNVVVPQFFTLLLLECLILRFRSPNSYKVRWNDLLTSAGHGIIYTVTSALTRGVELTGYDWLYARRLLNLNWTSPATWWTAAIGVDLGYYWFHRFVHEVNLGWSAHQVHHSSEDYNLSTALRQSVFQKFFSFGFYLPLAVVGVPLPALLVHLQFNLLYQFWIHTEVVTTLGPLEWVFNTASHHRVHHGSNPWCLDKNYAAVLIIWDRMFGTFQQERKDEKIIYGLVEQPQSFNIPWLQVYYYRATLGRALHQPTWSGSVRSLLYGPGWTEGSPRLGHAMPDTHKRTPARNKYDPKLPLVQEVYLISHFVVTLLVQQQLMTNFNSYSWLSSLLHTAYLLISLGNIGAMYDGWWGAAPLEAARCAAFFAVTSYYSVFDNHMLNTAVKGYCALSAVAWTIGSFVPRQTVKTSKKKSK